MNLIIDLKTPFTTKAGPNKIMFWNPNGICQNQIRFHLSFNFKFHTFTFYFLV